MLAAMLGAFLAPIASPFVRVILRGVSIPIEGGGDGGGAPEVEDTRAWEEPGPIGGV